MEYPDRKILPLRQSICVTMYQINLRNVAKVLLNLEEADPVVVEDDIKRDAKKALGQMLNL